MVLDYGCHIKYFCPVNIIIKQNPKEAHYGNKGINKTNRGSALRI